MGVERAAARFLATLAHSRQMGAAEARAGGAQRRTGTQERRLEAEWAEGFEKEAATRVQ